MSAESYLFPKRLSRRDFLATTGAIAASAALTRPASARPPVTIGEGKYTFTLDEAWGRLPEGMKYGHGCAIVADARDRIFVTSRSASPCVSIFDKDGTLLETWSKDIAGYTPAQVAATAHGLYWNREPDGEFLYWTENVAGGKDGNPRIGARVYKTDLEGKVLYTLGNVEKAGSTTQPFDFKNPTDVAIAPNGDIYIVDGYGSQLLHQFDKNFKPIKTIGGPGKDHGKFNTCHGIWINTLKKAEPEVYVADRANNRIEVYGLDLAYRRTIPDLRLPCCFYQYNGHLYVPELGARVSILDDQDRIVARLGDGQGIPAAEIDSHPDKFAAPHALTLTSNGDLYVLEWVPNGRPRRFRPTPKA